MELTNIVYLLIDCQATGAAPGGHLLEMGWQIGSASAVSSHNEKPISHLIALPEGECIPQPVQRVTGIKEDMLHDAVSAHAAWSRMLEQAARSLTPPYPCIIHYARYEEPFLRQLHGDDSSFPLDIICTHRLSQILLPGLPRKGLRAIAGYFGFGTDTVRRSDAHLDATAVVWRGLSALMQEQGIHDWQSAKQLMTTTKPRVRTRKDYPMPRRTRLSIPDSPGVYRMCRSDGSFLYVGKARSLKKRVNSYFQKQKGQSEHILEMLSQATALDVTQTDTALEAAMLECDEIKRLAPPYNRALTARGRELYFAAADLSDISAEPARNRPIGPLRGRDLLQALSLLAESMSRSSDPPSPAEALAVPDHYAPDATMFMEGYTRFAERFTTESRDTILKHFWKLGRHLALQEEVLETDGLDDEAEETETEREWSAEMVADCLELNCKRAYRQLGRSRWITRLLHCSLAWKPGDHWQHLDIRDGEIVNRQRSDTLPALKDPGSPHRVSRQKGWDEARYDRLRVLWSELRRVTYSGMPVRLRVHAAAPLTEKELGRVFSIY